ncbi:hypothetical protein FSP39_012090 [Pinctada imbricata]|uniref:Prominin-1-A n=1 Tax=Pinctada imbricata TaxID=66713 RepID=A0AA88YA50_PINIB|nr:hypothetical protein FSP39_012090 [Pinctada imbricata]
MTMISKDILTLSCLICISACVLSVVKAADPVLSPETISDSNGNSADRNSDITWSDIPTFATYLAGSVVYNDNGLGPMYDFAKSFINGGVFPYDLPWGKINHLLLQTIHVNMMRNYILYLRQFGGYGACIIIGFLFIFLFPIIGFCFCCCRCCGNCGGKMEQNKSDAGAHIKRRIFACILFVLIAFTLAGNVSVFVTNDQISYALDNIDDAVTRNLDDLSSYVNNTIDQIRYVANDNFNFTLDVVFRDLDNIAYILGIPLRQSLSNSGGINNAINSGYALENRVSSISNTLLAVNTTLDDVKTKGNILKSNLSDLKADIDTTCVSPCSINTAGVVIGFDNNDFPDISDPVSKISDVQAQNLTAVVVDAQKEFDDIPWRVHNESLTAVTDLKDMISNFSGKLDDLVDQMVTAQDSLSGSTLNDFKTQVRDYVDIAEQYDKYRHYGGVALGCTVLLVVVLQFFGLAFGVLGHRDVSPVNRGCMGTTGGNMLMASVGFVFIFSWLLMLLTTLTFIIGAPLEKFLCKTLTSPDMSDLDELVDERIFKIMYPDRDSGTLLGVAIFGNDTVDLKFTQMLQDCQAGKAAYVAFKLDNLFDISNFINYTNTMNISGEIDKIQNNIDLSDIEVLTPDLTSQLNNLKDSVNVNFTQFRDQLNKNATDQDLVDLANQLDTAASAASGITKTNLEALRDRTLAINNTEYANVMTAMTQLGTDLDSLETAVNGTTGDVDDVIVNFNTTQEYLRNNASSTIADEVRTYSDRIFSIIDSYIADVLYALNNELGTCEPIWTLYNSLVVITFCNYTIDTLNGFWFGLGWCIFFFVPSIIFAVKLAKHYRRMKQSDYNQNASFSSKNKVGHRDPAPPPYESNW